MQLKQLMPSRPWIELGIQRSFGIGHHQHPQTSGVRLACGSEDCGALLGLQPTR